MLCEACKKLALLPRPHQCVDCPRFCDYKEQKWCSFCGALKEICQVCAKPMDYKKTITPGEKRVTQQAVKPDKAHPFFGNKTGCKSCGG